jgi:hypothetical protein
MDTGRRDDETGALPSPKFSVQSRTSPSSSLALSEKATRSELGPVPAEAEKTVVGAWLMGAGVGAVLVFVDDEVVEVVELVVDVVGDGSPPVPARQPAKAKARRVKPTRRTDRRTAKAC